MISQKYYHHINEYLQIINILTFWIFLNNTLHDTVMIQLLANIFVLSKPIEFAD